MKFLTSVACLLSVAAASAVRRDTAPASFKLKTINSPLPAHNNLYVTPFHTGAGTNDVTLSSDASKVPTASLNGTNLTFALPGGPWYGLLDSSNTYAGMH